MKTIREVKPALSRESFKGLGQPTPQYLCQYLYLYFPFTQHEAILTKFNKNFKSIRFTTN